MQIGSSQQSVLAKRYAGRRLYRPVRGAYLMRQELITMAMNGENFVVIDASTREDVTHCYRPIIVEH
jgi:polyhydroxyalkanoate synthesis regulator protein